MDVEFREQVERARRMTPAERASEGLRLRDAWWAGLLDEIRQELPGISDEDAQRIRAERWREESRRRSEEKLRILDMIAAENAAPRSTGW